MPRTRMPQPDHRRLSPPSASAARLDPLLEPAGELLEGRAEVWHGTPDQREQRTGVFLAHVKRDVAVPARGHIVGPDAAEQAERHAPAEPQVSRRLEARDLD